MVHESLQQPHNNNSNNYPGLNAYHVSDSVSVLYTLINHYNPMRWVLLFTLSLKNILRFGDIHLLLYPAKVVGFQYNPRNLSREPRGLSICPSLMPTIIYMRKLKLRKSKRLI